MTDDRMVVGWYTIREKGDGFALWRHDPRRDGPHARQIGMFGSRERAEKIRDEHVRDDAAWLGFKAVIRSAEKCNDPQRLHIARMVLEGGPSNADEVADLLDLALPHHVSYAGPVTPRRHTVNPDLRPVPAEAVAAMDTHLLDEEVA